MKKGIFSMAIILVVAMIVGIFAPLTAFADDPAEPIIYSMADDDPVVFNNGGNAVVGNCWDGAPVGTAEIVNGVEKVVITSDIAQWGGGWVEHDFNDIDFTTYKYGAVVYKAEFAATTTLSVITGGAANLISPAPINQGWTVGTFATASMQYNRVGFSINGYDAAGIAAADKNTLYIAAVAFFETEAEAKAFKLPVNYGDMMIFDYSGSDANVGAFSMGQGYPGYPDGETGVEAYDATLGAVTITVAENKGASVENYAHWESTDPYTWDNEAGAWVCDYSVFSITAAALLDNSPYLSLSIGTGGATTIYSLPGSNANRVAGTFPANKGFFTYTDSTSKINYCAINLSIFGNGAETAAGDGVAVKSIVFANSMYDAENYNLIDYLKWQIANPPENPDEPGPVGPTEPQFFFDGEAVEAFLTIEELGGLRCTNHANCYVDDEDFFAYDDYDLWTDPVIKTKLTKNASFAKFSVEWVEDYGDDEEDGLLVKFTPVDNFVANDVSVEGQFYVIRNVSYKAHKSNSVTFDMRFTNRYIDDYDIEAVAGECELIIDSEAYVIKTTQFAEAEDKELSVLWQEDGEDYFQIDFSSVRGQKGMNFGFTDGDIAEIEAIDSAVKYASMIFGSKETVVADAKITIFVGGEGFLYRIDKDGNVTYGGAGAAEGITEITFDIKAGETLGSFAFTETKLTLPEPKPVDEPEPEKEAPSTGAVEMMSVAAFAVATVVVAAVAAKKSK